MALAVRSKKIQISQARKDDPLIVPLLRELSSSAIIRDSREGGQSIPLPVAQEGLAMTHMQKTPDHTHESESRKDFKIADISAFAGASSHGGLHSEAKHVNASKGVATGLEKPPGPGITGV